MAVYNKERGLQSVLNAALGEYHAKGFRLIEPDDHILELYYYDSVVARFLQNRATVSTIRETCQGYLEELAGR